MYIMLRKLYESRYSNINMHKIINNKKSIVLSIIFLIEKMKKKAGIFFNFRLDPLFTDANPRIRNKMVQIRNTVSGEGA